MERKISSKEDFEFFKWIRERGKVSYKINLEEFFGIQCLKEKSPEDQIDIAKKSIDNLGDLGLVTYQSEKKGFFKKEEYWTLRRGVKEIYSNINTYEEFKEKCKGV